MLKKATLKIKNKKKKNRKLKQQSAFNSFELHQTEPGVFFLFMGNMGFPLETSQQDVHTDLCISGIKEQIYFVVFSPECSTKQRQQCT